MAAARFIVSLLRPRRLIALVLTWCLAVSCVRAARHQLALASQLRSVPVRGSPVVTK